MYKNMPNLGVVYSTTIVKKFKGTPHLMIVYTWQNFISYE